LHRCKKELQESTWKQSESLTLAKGYVNFYLHCTRAKKTIVAAVPMPCWKYHHAYTIYTSYADVFKRSNRHLKSYGLSVSRYNIIIISEYTVYVSLNIMLVSALHFLECVCVCLCVCLCDFFTFRASSSRTRGLESLSLLST